MAGHWSDAWMDRPYEPGVFDCAELAVEVAREQFGKNVEILTERAASALGRTRQVQEGAQELADRVESPEEGDAVLMISRGRPSHVGVYCLIDGEPWVLHAMKNAGRVVRHPLRSLPTINLSVEGFYRWKP